jgi:hypothetical protein
MTRQSELLLPPEGMSSLEIMKNSLTSECITSIISDLVTLKLWAQALKSHKPGKNLQISTKMRPVTGITMATVPAHVAASICAASAKTPPMWNWTVQNSERSEARNYLWNYVWNNRDIGVSLCVLSTEYEAPLPHPPASEFANSDAMNMIWENPHLHLEKPFGLN